MSRDENEYCVFSSSSLNKTRNYSDRNYERGQAQNLTSTHEDAHHETFNYRSSPKEADIALPSCCMAQGLPVYRTMKDPTITSAPKLPAAKSDCCCKPVDYREVNQGGPSTQELVKINLPPGGHKSYPGIMIPMQPSNVPTYHGGQQFNAMISPPHGSVPLGATFTAENVQASSQPRNMPNRTTSSRSRFIAAQNAIRAAQYLRRQKTETETRPLGFDHLIGQNNEVVNRPLYFDQYMEGNRPLGFEGYQAHQKTQTISRPLGFGHLKNQTYETSNRPLGLGPYVPANVPIPAKTTVIDPFSAEDMTFDRSSEYYPDLGPWRNFDIPKNIKKVNIASSANKSYPRTIVPPPSRNYSTYDDHHQPILNVREVAMHRKRAPRFHSTPTEEDFLNEGMNISSVWGQDVDSMRETPTNSYVDSSLGWSQGVRMDSFNVLTEVTPSPKNVKVPPRLNTSYMPQTTTKKTNPAFQTTHTYIQNPYAHLEYLQTLPFGVLPSDNKRAGMRGRTIRKPNIPDIRAKRSKSPVNKRASGGAVPTAQNKTYCEPCGNATFSGGNTDKSSRPQAQDKTITVIKKSEEHDPKNPQAEKDFCTVLEIRTPCGNDPSHSDKPLQLSINVTCADPSLLVTPDKRYNVISNKSTPEVSAQSDSSNRLEGVPSDCECE